jgi:hypothetical protein
MWIRKIIVHVFYYYLLAMLTGAFCICFTALKGEERAWIFWACVVVYLLLALLVNIVFVRRQAIMSRMAFIFSAISFFIVFVLPPLYMLMELILSAQDNSY